MRRNGLLGLILLFLLSGCESILEGNLYSAFDSLTPLTASQMANADLEEIQVRSTSQTFFLQLRAYPEAQAALATNLSDKMNNVALPDADRIEAARLYILAQSQGTVAVHAVNNLMKSLLPTLTTSGTTSLSSDPVALQSAMRDIFGTKVSQIRSAVTALASVVDAMDILVSLGGIDTELGGDVIQASIIASFAYTLLLTADAPADVTSVSDLIVSTDPNNTVPLQFDEVTLQSLILDIGDAFTDPSTYAGYFSYLGPVINLLPQGAL